MMVATIKQPIPEMARKRFDRPRATSTQSGFAEVGCPEAQQRTRGRTLNRVGKFGSRLSRIVLAHSSAQMMPTRPVVGAARFPDPSNDMRVCIPNKVSEIWIKAFENKVWPL
jgi:hypothetical protein